MPAAFGKMWMDNIVWPEAYRKLPAVKGEDVFLCDRLVDGHNASGLQTSKRDANVLAKNGVA